MTLNEILGGSWLADGEAEEVVFCSCPDCGGKGVVLDFVPGLGAVPIECETCEGETELLCLL